MKGPSEAVDLFENEDRLRDWIAEHLERLEPGLTLVDKEYTLRSDRGARGSVDILAKDKTGLFVAVEIKKSDKSARELVHEMSKYVVRLRYEEHLDAAEVRCIAVSTNWHELLEAYSFFAARDDVDAIGYLVVRQADGSPAFTMVPLLPLQNLPKFSAEFSIYYYESEAQRAAHVKSVRRRVKSLPFLRIAMVELDARKAGPGELLYAAIASIWRIDEQRFGEIERVGGFEIGHLEPYGFPGWEAECDVLYWAIDCADSTGIDISADDSRGTAEKVTNLLARYRVARTQRIGDWKGAGLTDDARILELLRAGAGRLPVGRGNRYELSTTVDPHRNVAWEAEMDRLLEFIGYERLWRDEIVRFRTVVESLPSCSSVVIEARDSRHFFYRVHQAVEFPQTNLSYFVIRALDAGGKDLRTMYGFWSWDGTTSAVDANASIEAVYGSLPRAVVSVFSAVDDNRYEEAYRNHGFQPAVAELGPGTPTRLLRLLPRLTAPSTSWKENALHEFVEANREYAESVSRAFCSLGTIPRDPRA